MGTQRISWIIGVLFVLGLCLNVLFLQEGYYRQ